MHYREQISVGFNITFKCLVQSADKSLKTTANKKVVAPTIHIDIATFIASGLLT